MTTVNGYCIALYNLNDEHVCEVNIKADGSQGSIADAIVRIVQIECGSDMHSGDRIEVMNHEWEE